MSWNNFGDSMQNEGGFMDVSVNDGAGGDDKGNLKRGQNCIPVMIGHILKHGEKLNVWGSPAKIVTFVAIVRNIDSVSTKVTFQLQDETGQIKGMKWLEGENTTFESPVQVNSYARVYGLIREQGSEPYVLMLNVQPMEHLNELLSHLMEVTLVSLQGQKKHESGGSMNNSVAGTTLNSTATMAGGVNAAGLTQQQQMILDIIKSSDPEYGAERDAIKSRVPPGMASKVDDIIEFLSAEGHIYTTKTDDFFKAI